MALKDHSDEERMYSDEEYFDTTSSYLSLFERRLLGAENQSFGSRANRRNWRKRVARMRNRMAQQVTW